MNCSFFLWLKMVLVAVPTLVILGFGIDQTDCMDFARHALEVDTQYRVGRFVAGSMQSAWLNTEGRAGQQEPGSLQKFRR